MNNVLWAKQAAFWFRKMLNSDQFQDSFYKRQLNLMHDINQTSTCLSTCIPSYICIYIYAYAILLWTEINQRVVIPFS